MPAISSSSASIISFSWSLINSYNLSIPRMDSSSPKLWPWHKHGKWHTYDTGQDDRALPAQTGTGTEVPERSVAGDPPRDQKSRTRVYRRVRWGAPSLGCPVTFHSSPSPCFLGVHPWHLSCITCLTGHTQELRRNLCCRWENGDPQKAIWPSINLMLSKKTLGYKVVRLRGQAGHTQLQEEAQRVTWQLS